MKITNIERYILESLSKEKKTMTRIKYETKLEEKTVQNTIQLLIVKGLINVKGNEYSINKDLYEKYAKSINSNSNLFREIKKTVENILYRALHKQEHTDLKMKKIYFTSKDQKIFNSLLMNIEDFIKENNRADEVPISQQRIYFSLQDSYLASINQFV
jgi:predicted transcriptional regulator